MRSSSPARGRIVLAGTARGCLVRIDVEDTGPGMTEPNARLFQRFSQTSFGAGLGGSGLDCRSCISSRN
ncbi:MAG: sensor histidine kinase [Xanthomonadales bacterium]|nr:sensor histidine kinase [Xanthomonadales bacterium]